MKFLHIDQHSGIFPYPHLFFLFQTLGLLFIFSGYLLSQSDSYRFSTGKTPGHIDFFEHPGEVPAHRIHYPLKIDGRLTEEVWQLTGVTGFTQQDPLEGEPATEKTVVWVAYDDEALYVAARMYDRAPDSIVARLGRRDQDLSSDIIGFAIDSYNDKQTGFFFWITPAGAFGDGTISNDSRFDDTWDGVWEYGVQMDSLGWSVELRIPFSQLRFTRKEEYVWGFNVMRFIQRKQETSFLVLIPKDSNKGVSLYPPLTGIRNIQPPHRVEIMPYFLSSGQFRRFSPDDPFGRNKRFVGDLGADLKLGLGSNFTLNGTINPDFGQVELDPAVVNLTAFETFFEEKRPFFIEGASIFSFGNRGATSNWTMNYNPPIFFYSRRIGRPPQGRTTHQGVVNTPSNSTILGAAKVTGQTKNNLEIGILQAVTAREYAEIDSSGVRLREEVEPLTSYTVVRTFKNFDKNRFGLGVMGTSLIRQLRTENLQRDFRKNAFVGGIDGYVFLGKKRNWAVNGWLVGSYVSGSKEAITDLQQTPQHYYQRPDFKYESLDTTRTVLRGWTGRLMLNKEKGNYYLNTSVAVNSPGFESNDLGFHFKGNVINQHLVLGYRWFQPGKVFRNANWFVANFRTFDFDGNKTSEGYMSFFGGRFLNYSGFFARAGYFLKTLDITRTRGGPMMENPPGFFVGLSLSSDSRKDFELGISGNYGANRPGGWEYSVETRFNWKPGTQLNLSFTPRFYRDHAIAQWVTAIDDPAAAHTFGKRYIFAILDQKQISASLRLNYTFTPTLSFQMFFQPLLAAGTYSDFKELARPRSFDFIHYGQNGTSITPSDNQYEIDPDGTGQHRFTLYNPDFNFRSLRGTAVLRWEFAPGSTLFLVWTHDRSDVENQGMFDVRNDFDKLLNADSDNIILLKLRYWWNP